MDVEKLEIVQQRGKGQVLSASLIRERELHIEDALNRKTINYVIDVVALGEQSKRKVIMGWQWLAAGLVVILVSFMLPSLLSSVFSETLLKYLVYLLGILAGLGCFYMAWKATSARQIFYSRHAKVPIIELFAGKPSTKKFEGFINKVEESIRATQDKLNLSMKNQLAGEMKMLRRLSEEGVVSASEYKKAKAVLFSMHQ
ncbi:hypothetical protein [Kaarinaea lacus]